MYCEKALLSYEDKQVNLTIQLNDEEWEGLLFECRRRNKNIEDCLIETCDAMFRLAEEESDKENDYKKEKFI